jgi:hypothetical protein
MDQVVLEQIFAKDMSGVTGKYTRLLQRNRTMSFLTMKFENPELTHRWLLALFTNTPNHALYEGRI